MMASYEDRAFRAAFESGAVALQDFTHAAHVRLAYVYLCENSVSTASDCMKRAILGFLVRNDVAPDKFHETITKAWIMAVRHFMQEAGNPRSFADFLAHDDRILKTDIMLTHYSRPRLFSRAAQQRFMAPDLDPIPVYA